MGGELEERTYISVFVFYIRAGVCKAEQPLLQLPFLSFPLSFHHLHPAISLILPLNLVFGIPLILLHTPNQFF